MNSLIKIASTFLVFCSAQVIAAPDVSVIVDGQRMQCGKGGGNNGEGGSKYSFGCECTKSGSYTKVIYSKYNRGSGRSSKIKELTGWVDGEDGRMQCQQMVKSHALCKNGKRRGQ